VLFAFEALFLVRVVASLSENKPTVFLEDQGMASWLKGSVEVPLVFTSRQGRLGVVPTLSKEPAAKTLAAARSFLKHFPDAKVVIAYGGSEVVYKTPAKSGSSRAYLSAGCRSSLGGGPPCHRAPGATGASRRGLLTKPAARTPPAPARSLAIKAARVRRLEFPPYLRLTSAPMKGLVFNLLADLVRRNHGEDTWDALLDAAGATGAYTSLGSYPDEEMMRLVSAASAALKVPPDEVLRWFGRAVLPELAKAFPQFFSPHRDTRSFLLTLNEVIHPEVRKLYPGADVPHFDYDNSSLQVLRMGYVSSRQLCAFGMGLIEGAADHYGEELQLTQPECAKRGDPKCVFHISFTGP
jgi:hypothetical protein